MEIQVLFHFVLQNVFICYFSHVLEGFTKTNDTTQIINENEVIFENITNARIFHNHMSNAESSVGYIDLVITATTDSSLHIEENEDLSEDHNLKFEGKQHC